MGTMSTSMARLLHNQAIQTNIFRSNFSENPILKNSTIYRSNQGKLIDISYRLSINMTSIKIPNTELTIGAPISAGVQISTSGNISADIKKGIDILGVKFQQSKNIKIGLDDIVQYGENSGIGYKDTLYGTGMRISAAPSKEISVYGWGEQPYGESSKQYVEEGTYIKTGLIYAVVVAALLIIQRGEVPQGLLQEMTKCSLTY